MAAYTTSQAGNWSQTGTWGGSGPPGIGDTATINHAVTVDSNVTLGTYPDPRSTVLNVNATLTIAQNVSLTVRGEIECNNARIEGGEGSTLHLDVGSTGEVYRYLVGRAAAQVNARIEMTGTSSNPCTLSGGPVKDSGFIYGGQLRCTHTTLSGLTGEDNTFYPANNTIYLWYLDNCTIDGCATFVTTQPIQAESRIRISHSKFIAGTGTYDIDFNYSTDAMTTGQRLFEYSDFGKSIRLLGPRNLTVNYVIFRNGWDVSAASVTWGTWANIVLVKTAQGAHPLIGSITNLYVVGTYSGGNQHGLQFHSTGNWNVVLDGAVFDMDPSDEAGDMILHNASNTNTRRCDIQYVLVLPRRSNKTSAPGNTVTGLHPTSGTTCKVEHCTGPASSLFVGLGETQSGYAGFMDSCRGNLAYGWSAGGTVIGSAGAPADDIVTDADTNCGWNLTGGAAFTDNYTIGAAKIANPAGGADVNVDPQFVDMTRDITTWRSAGSVSAALDLLSRDGAAYDELWAYVRGGFAPQNDLLRNQAWDGNDIGAVSVIAGLGPLLIHLRNQLVRA